MNNTDLMKFFGCEPLETPFPTFRELIDQNFKQITIERGVYFVIDETTPEEFIAYIGMASTSLRSRVKALVLKKENHHGGSDIWELPHYESLRICWKVNKCARDYKEEFIQRFKTLHDCPICRNTPSRDPSESAAKAHPLDQRMATPSR